MNGTSRIEQFNQAVRSLVTIVLTIGFLYGFWQALIGPDIYATMYATVLGFWFGSRDQKSRASDGTTTTTETVAGAGESKPAVTKTIVAPVPPAG